MLTDRIKRALCDRHPEADLSRYFSLLESATGSDHKHHICPRIPFTELVADSDNILTLSFQEHFYAHYLLALAVPEYCAYQISVYFVANVYAKDIKTDELPMWAEVYKRGALAAAAAQCTPEARRRQSELQKELQKNPVYRACQKAAQILCKNLPEEVEKQRASAIRAWTPEARAHASAAQLKRWHPELA